VHIKSRVYRVGDPDEEGTVFDRETEAVSTYGVCSTCFREVWNETPTSRMVRKRIQDVLTQARAALIDAARVIESAIRSTLAAMEAERDARFVREALTRLGLDPSGGEEALLAWATAPERHDALPVAAGPNRRVFRRYPQPAGCRRASCGVGRHRLVGSDA
jgi:hypothetical protein